MKKLTNAVDDILAQSLAGFGAAHGDIVKVGYDPKLVVRADAPLSGKVALISGGGSGHEPLHAGFVGQGMLSAACPGEIFTSPTPDQMLAAAQAVDGGAGCLFIVKNYSGDVMNFEMAAEMAVDMGVEMATVLTNDDVAVEDSSFTQGRRGVAGTIGAMVCRALRGNARTHWCVYHQWTYDERGTLRGVPFQKGLNDKTGMPADFKTAEHSLRPVRVEAYRGLIFGSLNEEAPDLTTYIGPEMLPWVDRIFCKPVQYLGCTRQYAKSNWKLYYENVKDPYHASLLHLFHTTFNIYRSNMLGRSIVDSRHGLHALITSTPLTDAETSGDYKSHDISTYDEQLKLADPSLLDTRDEYAEQTSNNIHTLFPSTVIQQIHNTLAVRQVLPKSASEFELVFHFFGYEDDDDELRNMRLRQANLAGPAGYISMEDTEATELVQRAVSSCAEGDESYIAMGDEDSDKGSSLITEHMIRSFWRGYRDMMGWAT